MVWNRNKPSNRKTWPWRRKRPWTRRLSVKQLPRSVARKRSDWFWFYNDAGAFDAATGQGCRIRCVEFGADYCENPSVRIPIMPEAAVEALYNDDITIAEMRGFINMRPRWVFRDQCDMTGWLTQMASEKYPIYMRAGLYKQELTVGQGGIPPFVDPNIGDDWTDVRALKKWQHIWQPRGRHSQTWQMPTKIIGVCSDVSKPSVSVPGWVLGSGSGNWAGYTEPAITTSCDTVTVGNGEGACNVAELNFERELPTWYRMSLNRRSPVRLHENDSLDIFMNWSMPREGTDCDPLCGADFEGENPCAMMFNINLAVRLVQG